MAQVSKTPSKLKATFLVHTTPYSRQTPLGVGKSSNVVQTTIQCNFRKRSTIGLTDDNELTSIGCSPTPSAASLAGCATKFGVGKEVP